MDNVLLKRWFNPEEREQEVENRRKAAEDRLRSVREWVSHREFERQIKEISLMRRNSEPNVEDHMNMLFKTGVVKGIGMVLDHLIYLKQKAEEDYNNAG